MQHQVSRSEVPLRSESPTTIATAVSLIKPGNTNSQHLSPRWTRPMARSPSPGEIGLSSCAGIDLAYDTTSRSRIENAPSPFSSASSSISGHNGGQSPTLAGPQIDTHTRANENLEGLVECFRESAEENLRRPRVCTKAERGDGSASRSLSSSSSASASSSTSSSLSSSSSSSTTSASACELVSALQNHLKSAVAAAAVAAAAAATAANANSHTLCQPNDRLRVSQQQSCNQMSICNSSGRRCGASNNRSNANTANHHDLLPLDLKMLPDYDLFCGTNGLMTDGAEAASDEDEDVDLISIGTNDNLSGRVQHTEIVQTSIMCDDDDDCNSDSDSRLTQHLSSGQRFQQSTSFGGVLSMDENGSATSLSTTNVALQHNNRPSSQTQAVSSCISSTTVSKSSLLNNQQPRQNNDSSNFNQNNNYQHVKQRRLYKCRHCSFETDKKVENWQHIRIHMRPEKLLSCGSCLFVTEYKHHLEYHQRNHTGYKPFKCEHCDYTCVNKSMLNSHMKSHSSVYQYQCGDCKYATKYVHSLKMHLRKYNHQPAALMIDIFGRKRGPKPGSGRKHSHGGSTDLLSSSTPTASNVTSNGKSKNQKQSRQQQQQQAQQCNVLDLRISSKLEKSTKR